MKARQVIVGEFTPSDREQEFEELRPPTVGGESEPSSRAGHRVFVTDRANSTANGTE